MEARDDALPKRCGPFLPSDGGGGSEQAAVLGEHWRGGVPGGGGGDDVLLELEPDLGGVEWDGAYLREDAASKLKQIEGDGIRMPWEGSKSDLGAIAIRNETG